MSQFLAIPVRLEFKVSERRHTVAVAKEFGNRHFSLTNNVQAVISESHEGCVNKLIAAVTKEYVEAVVAAWPTTLVSDFRLVYSCNEITNTGRVWGGIGIVSSTSL